jgi:hypothetical protein
MALISDPEIFAFKLDDAQRKFLEHLQNLDRQYIFDSRYFRGINEILDKGFYHGSESEKLNDIRNAYVAWKQTGSVPILYQPDLPF